MAGENKEANHIEKMYDMHKMYSYGYMIKFIEYINRKCNRKIKFHCYFYFSGASVNLIYKKGELYQAITKGNGKNGIDITEKIKKIKGVPLKIDYKDTIEIRGSVVMKKSSLDLINKGRYQKKLKHFKNTKDGAEQILMKNYDNFDMLIFYPFDIGYCENCRKKTLSISMRDIHRFFHINKFFWIDGNIPLTSVLTDNQNEIVEYYKEVFKIRNKLDIDIDGIVIQPNLIEKQKIVGFDSIFSNFRAMLSFDQLENNINI